MQQQACFEVKAALEIWLTSEKRTVELLEMLVRHWCEVYARDTAYTEQAIQEATRLAERHVH